MKVEFFERINITVPTKRIYSRLGYARGKTKLSAEDADRYESYLDLALDQINLRGAASILAIKEIKEGKTYLDRDFNIESKVVAEFLQACQEVLFLGVTAGCDIMDLISKKKGTQNLDRSVVADAVASEMVDASLGWLADYKARALRRQNKAITQQRFSAGYGDFDLSYQEMIYSVLELDKIGVTLRKTYALEPEKSVTAIYGIKQK